MKLKYLSFIIPILAISVYATNPIEQEIENIKTIILKEKNNPNAAIDNLIKIGESLRSLDLLVNEQIQAVNNMNFNGIHLGTVGEGNFHFRLKRLFSKITYDISVSHSTTIGDLKRIFKQKTNEEIDRILTYKACLDDESLSEALCYTKNKLFTIVIKSYS